MNRLQRALAEVCRTHKLEQKLLLTGNLRSGHQLLESLSRAGESWLNITPVTPLGLALDLAGPGLDKAGVTLLSEGQILQIIDDVLADLAKDNKIAYFAGLEGDEGLAGIMLPTLLEMRAAKVSALSLAPDVFVDLKKGREINDLLEGFERRLQQDKLLDTAALFQAAAALIRKESSQNSKILYLVPEQLELSAVEYEFIDLYTTGRRIILPEEPLFGAKPAPAKLKRFHFQAESTPGEQVMEDYTFLAYLDSPDQAPADPGIEIEISRAYGPANEISSLLQKLRKGNIALDQARVCYTDAAVYLPLIYSISRQYGIPATFEDGISTAFTRPGKLLNGLLNWLVENYMVGHLVRLFYGGLLKVDAPLTMGRQLRQAEIGWGLARYRFCLQKAVEKAEERLQRELARQSGSHNPPDYLTARLAKAKKLQGIVVDILDFLPEPEVDGAVGFAELCCGLERLITTYAQVVGEEDAAAVKAIAEALKEAALSHAGKIDLKAAVKRIRRRLCGLQIGASGSKPGYLHVSGIGCAEWNYRLHTFVVGLNSGSFPGSGLQDPVLLDRERELINTGLSLKAPEPARNRYRLARFLASCRGRLYLSYSGYDPVEARPVMPASVLLQVYRLQQNDPAADYSKFEAVLETPAAYYPSDLEAALFIDHWWLYLALRDCKTAVELCGVQECFPGIKAGLLAQSCRDSDSFTPYDGLVVIDAAMVDPAVNPGLTMSASRLEKLGRCPFAYFLQNLLGIEPPDELEYDPGVWLDPATRGHLLHEIYASFLREMIDKDLNPIAEGARLETMGLELIEKRKGVLPPPSEVIYEYERGNLLRELKIFLKVEANLRQDGYVPVYLEVPFGISAQAVQDAHAGQEEPVTIELERGRQFKLRGIIDRIDKTDQDGIYRVLDYKTGSTYGYEDERYLEKGCSLQHGLYAIAVEEIFDKSVPGLKVREAGYIFPTVKGEGRAFIRDQGRRKELIEGLKLMFKLLSTGTFCVTSEDRCRFCDYQVVCREQFARRQIAVKLNNPANRMLEPWKELQEYE